MIPLEEFNRSERMPAGRAGRNKDGDGPSRSPAQATGSGRAFAGAAPALPARRTPPTPGAGDAWGIAVSAAPPVADLDVRVLAVRRSGTVCRLDLERPDAFVGARAGQFALLKSLAPGAPLLPRPLSLVPAAADTVTVIFNIKGEGTRVLAAAEPGDRVALIGPLGNAFAAPPEPLLIVTDAPHVGTMLALGLERRAAGHTDAFIYVADPASPHPSDAPLLAEIAAFGLAPVATSLADLAAVLAERAPAYLAAGASDAAMDIAQRHAVRAGIPGTASLQAQMACGLGVCQVCIHPKRSGDGPLLVCDGPIFPLDVPGFGAAA